MIHETCRFSNFFHRLVYFIKLIYCFEKQGVLENVDDENSVIPEINPSYYETLKVEGKIHSGMLPKLKNCFDAIEKGVKSVKISNPEVIRNENQLCTIITD